MSACQACTSGCRSSGAATASRMARHYGDILEWKYVDGLSVADIAARLGVGPKAAESLLTRARNAFREAILSMVDIPDALRAQRQDWSL